MTQDNILPEGTPSIMEAIARRATELVDTFNERLGPLEGRTLTPVDREQLTGEWLCYDRQVIEDNEENSSLTDDGIIENWIKPAIITLGDAFKDVKDIRFAEPGAPTEPGEGAVVVVFDRAAIPFRLRMSYSTLLWMGEYYLDENGEPETIWSEELDEEVLHKKYVSGTEVVLDAFVQPDPADTTVSPAAA